MKTKQVFTYIALGILCLLVTGFSYKLFFSIIDSRAGVTSSTIPPHLLSWIEQEVQGSGGQGSVVSETFESYGDNVLLTTSDDYNFASFPNRGSGGATNSSTIFEADTGWLYTDVDASGTVWAYSGRPIDWADKYFFRVNTQANLDVADQVVSFNYKSAAFGADGYGVEGGDATDIWMRYQNQYWLYVVQFDRTNNCIVAKRKVPAGEAADYGGNDSHISNKGVYYTLYTNSNQPIFGAGQQCISWAGVQSLLSAESGKPGFPNLAHDGTSATGTVYKFEARATTYNGGGAFNYVQLQLFRGNVLVGSWVDNNLGTNAGGQTFQADWNAGYYNAVPGSSTAWGYPIYTAGATGLRADNIKVWFDNFSYNAITESPIVTIGGSLSMLEPSLNVSIGSGGGSGFKLVVASGTTLFGVRDSGVSSSIVFGSSTRPACLSLADTDGSGVSYLSGNNGNLRVSSDGCANAQYPTNRWVSPFQGGNAVAATSNAAPASSTLLLHEVEIPQVCRVDRLAIIQGGTGTTADQFGVAIYGPIVTEETASGTPKLVQATSTFNGVSTNSATVITIPTTTLQPGRYYVGLQFSTTTITYMRHANQTQVAGWLGTMSVSGGYNQILPSSITNFTSTGSNGAGIRLRCS